MGPFLVFGNECILWAIDYVPTWVNATPMRTYEAMFVVKCWRENVFSRYGMPNNPLIYY